MNPIRSIPLRPNQISIWAHGNEQEAVHLVYDVLNYLEQWPNAIPAVAYQRADGEKYAHNWILDGTIQHIPLSYADTAVAGYNKVMISMMVDGGQANTIVFTGEVLEGIDTQGEEPTEEQQGIIEQINSQAVRAEEAADRAESAAMNWPVGDAGKLLYINAEGVQTPLVQGEYFEIVDGVLTFTGDVRMVVNDDGSVSLTGVTFVGNEDGSVTAQNAEFTEQTDGSVLID